MPQEFTNDDDDDEESLATQLVARFLDYGRGQGAGKFTLAVLGVY